MTSSIDDVFFEDPWGEIKGAPYPEARQLYRDSESFWVSRDQGGRLFFIHTRGGGDVLPLENLAGLDVKIERWGSGEARLICRLVSSDPGTEERFSTVAKDVAVHCKRYEGTRLFERAQERIKGWANFLKPSRSGLSRAELVGFFGELYVLSEVIMPLYPVDVSVRGWIGPDDKKQDFTLGEIAVEVKTTTSGDRQSVRISSLDQLDRVTDRLLLLRVVIAPTTDGEGVSIGELYESCVEKAKHDVFAESSFRLKTSYLHGKASERQLDERFQIVGISTYDVVDEFPRLTRSDVSPGIGDAGYDVMISAITEFELKDNFKELLGNG
jgi:hypothetical protein